MKRDDALALLKEYTKSESLLKHAFAVEAAMQAYAKVYGEDQNQWGITGLLHDFDYEKYPDEHPVKGQEILQDNGVERDIQIAILGHADYTDTPRESLMAKVLYAVDELCGFLTAVTLVRPNRSLSDVKLKSVKKKLKDKKFAAKVSREEIRAGAEQLGVDFDEHVVFTIQALVPVAELIGLNK